MSKLLRVLIAGTVISFITVPFLLAQSSLKLNTPATPFKNSGLKNDFLKIRYADSTFTKDSIFTNTKDSLFTVKNPVDKKFKMKKKPMLAVLLSALLPGAGQYYNQSYWKVPVILGITGYFGYEYWLQDKKFRDYRDQYSASQTQFPPNGDENLKTLREFYRNQRDNFTWYFLIAYVINLVDAYIDAHLFDFDVKEDKYTSGAVIRTYRLGLNVNF